MICLVTDRRRLAHRGDPEAALVALIAAAAGAGVDLVQVRERDLSAAQLVRLTRECVRAAAGTATRVVVNDRADVCLASEAHGVHLRGDSFSAAAVRTVLPANAWVGRSVHEREEAARAASAGGLDYLFFGTVFETASKQGAAPSGLDQLAAVCRSVRIPVIAIGGMTAARAADVARAGAQGLAGIDLFVPPAGVPPREYFDSLIPPLRRVFDTPHPLS